MSYTGLSDLKTGYPWEKDYGASPTPKSDPCNDARKMRAAYPDSWKFYVPRQYWDCSEPGYGVRRKSEFDGATAEGKTGTSSKKGSGPAAGSASNMGKGAGGGTPTTSKSGSSGSRASNAPYDRDLDPLLPKYAQASASAADGGEGIPLWLIIAGAAIGGIVLANQLSKKR